jgi:hypothetical protein
VPKKKFHKREKMFANAQRTIHDDVQRATKVAAAVLKYAHRRAGDADNAPITGNALGLNLNNSHTINN